MLGKTQTLICLDLRRMFFQKTRSQNKNFMEKTVKIKVIYDGRCGLCLSAVQTLKSMDMLKRLDYINLHDINANNIHPSLTQDMLKSQMHVIESNGSYYGGFEAFRRLCWQLPVLYPLLLLVYLPFAGVIGTCMYRWVALNRHAFNKQHDCKDDHCQR